MRTGRKGQKAPSFSDSPNPGPHKRTAVRLQHDHLVRAEAITYEEWLRLTSRKAVA